MLCECDETNPVRYEMVQAQSVGICVILPWKLFVVDLWELKGCKATFNTGWSTLFYSLFLLFALFAEFVLTPALTLSGTREEDLWLQPDGPVRVHCGRGRSVGQAHQVLPLFLLHQHIEKQRLYCCGLLNTETHNLPCGRLGGWHICGPQAAAPSWLPSSPPPSLLSGWPATNSCKQTQNCRGSRSLWINWRQKQPETMFQHTLSMSTGQKRWSPGPRKCWCDETSQWRLLWISDRCTLQGLSWRCETRSVKHITGWTQHRDEEAGAVLIIWTPYSLVLVGLKAVHVVGTSDAPGA